MMNHRVSIVLLAMLAAQFVEANSAFNVGFLGGLDSNGGRQGGGGFLTSSFGNTMDLAQGIPNMLNNAVQQVTKPLDGIVGSVLNPVGSTLSGLSSLTGGLTGQIGAGLSLGSANSPAGAIANQLGRATGAGSSALNGLSLPTGLVGGLATGLAAATGLNSVTNAATAATQGLINPGRVAGALSAGSASAISGAARAAGAMQGVAQTAGAMQGIAQTAGAMSAAHQAASAVGGALAGSSSLASMATANSLAGGSMLGGMYNGNHNSMAAASASAAAGQLGGQNSLANSMGAMSAMNPMAQYNNHMQFRREAIASGLGAGNSIGAQAELMSGAGGLGGYGAGYGAGLGSGAAAAAAAATGAGAGVGAAVGQSLSGYGGYGSYGGYGYGMGRAEEAAGAIGAAGALAGAGNQLALGSALSGAAAGASHLPYLAAQQAGHEAAALGAAAANSQMAMGAGVAAADQLIQGAAHHPGMALNRAAARNAIDSTARSLGASRALEVAAGPLAGNGAAMAQASGAVAAETALTEPLIENPLSPGRQGLASEAHANAEAEAAIAGSDMAAHGLENSQSASLATNAYRQAKLASARDRVNIAGTIQNSARISDAAIATHDAATKAEDSLLGSELAVDSAATVLDSDAAYIPPVTSSMLRSLPYGRLGLRNIIPKPLTYPSVLLPDVWLNGLPVNYKNVPFRMMPYSIGAENLATAGGVYGVNRLGEPAATGVAGPSSAAANSGLFLEGQPILSNNGIYLNGLLIDPKYAYLRNVNNRIEGSSIMPILANGQLEAQDEVAMANLLTAQQQLGPGMLGTYGGFGRMNTVPMLTGQVSDANLAPTTTVGTTYPIGSALVVEPRDSYFQDYIDNASSRQNFDERQQ